MNEADEQRERIRSKVAASQARLKRGGLALSARQSPARFPDAYPPEDYRSLAREYPWLVVAAGLGAGLLVGALVPRGVGGKFGKRALAVAGVAGELALALGRSTPREDAAVDDAEESAVVSQAENGGNGAGQLRRRAARIAGTARGNARDAGLFVAREAIKLAARARK